MNVRILPGNFQVERRLGRRVLGQRAGHITPAQDDALCNAPAESFAGGSSNCGQRQGRPSKAAAGRPRADATPCRA